MGRVSVAIEGCDKKPLCAGQLWRIPQRMTPAPGKSQGNTALQGNSRRPGGASQLQPTGFPEPGSAAPPPPLPGAASPSAAAAAAGGAQGPAPGCGHSSERAEVRNGG